MAKQLGLHTTQYQRYERAETTIPADIIVDIAKYHNVSTDYILGLTNNPKTSWTNNKIKNNVVIKNNKKINKIEIK